MERLLRLACQVAIDGDEVARARDLARDDDLVLAQAGLEGEGGRLHGGDHHALVQDVLRTPAQVAVGVLLHLGNDEFLVERSAIDADTHGLAVIDGHLADGGELFIAATAGADVAGIDAVLVERRGAVRVAREQEVAVVVEVADERCGAAGVEHPLLDLGDGGSRFRQVDRDAHEFGPGLGQLDALLRRGGRVGRVGHRHRLDHDGRAAANLHVADLDADGLVEPHRSRHRRHHTNRSCQPVVTVLFK